MSEAEEVASNEGFKRGMTAGAAKARSSSSSASSVSAPSLDDNQSITWELLLVLGIVLLLISPVGNWLASIVREISTHHNMNLTFNPLDTKTSTTMGPMQPASGESNRSVGHYTVNLSGGGQMTVNANSPQAAVENVKAEGGTPA